VPPVPAAEAAEQETRRPNSHRRSAEPIHYANQGGAGHPSAGQPRPDNPAPEPEPQRPHSHRRAGQPVYHTSAVYGGGGAQPKQVKRRTRLVMVSAGVLAVLVVALVVVVVVVKPGSSSAPQFGLIPTAGSAPQDADQVATAFLTAWQEGDLQKAANLTDQPTTAQAALAGYAKDLNLGKFGATAGAVTSVTGSTATQPRESVTFAVKASVAASSSKSAERASWSYNSSLVAYQKPNSSVWFVEWQPDVLAPNLTATEHLAAVDVPPTVSMVTDASGQNLENYKDPGLDTIAGLLAKDAPTNEGANPGLDVQIETKNGTAVPNTQGILVDPGNYPTLSTTINAKAENAARAAVAQHSGSSMVAIQPSTGHILAIANNAGDNDFALTAAVAPGSDMKIITSTALFNAGLVTPSTGVDCPASLYVTGVTIHNDEGESEPAGTPFSYDFAQSCNNAFTQWYPHLYGKLASTAKNYYGLNQPWDIGIGNLSASYFNAPANAVNSELAEEAFGQGELIASPLAMASVAATVESGVFKQPVLTLNAKQSVTAKPLPASTDADLKVMMRDVVTEGTAEGLGFGPDVYAKTGTADVGGQEQPNSWFVAFDPAEDVAVAFLDVNAGYGAQFAAPETLSFLNAY
jgi:Penicillin binding protein transpeptidase domain/NTF2-like N-terminal transpeptidase domain